MSLIDRRSFLMFVAFILPQTVAAGPEKAAPLSVIYYYLPG